MSKHNLSTTYYGTPKYVSKHKIMRSGIRDLWEYGLPRCTLDDKARPIRIFTRNGLVQFDGFAEVGPHENRKMKLYYHIDRKRDMIVAILAVALVAMSYSITVDSSTKVQIAWIVAALIVACTGYALIPLLLMRLSYRVGDTWDSFDEGKVIFSVKEYVDILESTGHMDKQSHWRLLEDLKDEIDLALKDDTRKERAVQHLVHLNELRESGGTDTETMSMRSDSMQSLQLICQLAREEHELQKKLVRKSIDELNRFKTRHLTRGFDFL